MDEFRPIKTDDISHVQMLLACFEYLGGVPAELVLDQDKLVAVSENYGDIIFTYEFENFTQAYAAITGYMEVL